MKRKKLTDLDKPSLRRRHPVYLFIRNYWEPAEGLVVGEFSGRRGGGQVKMLELDIFPGIKHHVVQLKETRWGVPAGGLPLGPVGLEKPKSVMIGEGVQGMAEEVSVHVVYRTGKEGQRAGGRQRDWPRTLTQETGRFPTRHLRCHLREVSVIILVLGM